MPSASKGISSAEEFYVHALAIEREAAARYWEFAHQLLLYRKNAVAQVFLQLARMETQRLEDLELKAAGMRLPRLEAAEHRWEGLDNAEGILLPTAQCLMKPRQALEIALANERRAKDFFERASAAARDPRIRSLAAERAGEEAQHVACIERALHDAPLPQSERRCAATTPEKLPHTLRP